MKWVNLLPLAWDCIWEPLKIPIVFWSNENTSTTSGLRKKKKKTHLRWSFKAHPVREETLWSLKTCWRDYSLHPIWSVSSEAKRSITFISHQLQHVCTATAQLAFILGRFCDAFQRQKWWKSDQNKYKDLLHVGVGGRNKQVLLLARPFSGSFPS